MEAIHRPNASPGQRSCAACGEVFADDPRFCPNCGTEVRLPVMMTPPQPRPEPRSTFADPFAVSTSASSNRGRPWRVIAALIAAGLILVVLAALLVSVNGKVGKRDTALAGARARAKGLAAKVSSLDSQVGTLTDEKSDLKAQNSSLSSAVIDCKDAATKMSKVIKVIFQGSVGNASLSDFRSSMVAANRAWSRCRVEANSNGAI